MTNAKIMKVLCVGALAALLPLAACDSILDVDAPGTIPDEQLDNPQMFDGLVVGASFNLMGAYDATTQDIALAAGELFHGGSYDFGDLPRGVIQPEDVNGEWGQMQQARWVAEDAVERMRAGMSESQFNRSWRVARVYVLGGFANRLLGENLCATAIDGGPEESHAVHFARAAEQFTQAIAIGEAAGEDDIVMAAYGGRASVRAWQGDWDGAVSDAEQVPVDFAYHAIFSSTNVNDLKYETHNRFEFTVFSTEFADHPGDLRAVWDTVFNNDGSVANGANGATPMYQQLKYTDDGSDVPVTKGTEMLVLRAEAALREGQIGDMADLLNDARAHYGMDPLDEPATVEEAWEVLHFERGAETWLEARRLWDLRRWFEASPDSPEYHPFLEGRDTCFPISDEERRSNENLSG